MAINKLPTDFVDAVTSQQKYKVTDVGNNESLFEDVSTYSTSGSPFGAQEINTQHQAINDTISLAENTDASLSKLMNGTTILDSATHADSVISATSATTTNRATTASQFSASPTINNVTFDGTQDITIEDSTKVALNESFVLCAKQSLTFTNKVCTLSDNRITANSLADVIFTSDCIDRARNAIISVETSNGAVTLTSGRTPQGTIKASIYIRVVE